VFQETSLIVTTGGYQREVNYIFHTISPKWIVGDNYTNNLKTKSCLFNILKTAVDLKLTSLIIPPFVNVISDQSYDQQFPQDCADLILKNIVEWCLVNELGPLE